MSRKKQGSLKPRRNSVKSWHQIVADSMYDECDRHSGLAQGILGLQQVVNSGNRKMTEALRKSVNDIEKLSWEAPEFTMPRDAPQIRIGIMGPSASSRTAILTTFGGGDVTSLKKQLGLRFKKTMAVLDNPYLLLIREEVGEPPKDFVNWLDVLVLISDSFANTWTAAEYLKQVKKVREIGNIVVVLGYVKPSGKSINRKAFKDEFFCLNEDKAFINYEVDVDVNSSVKQMFEVGCIAYVEGIQTRQLPIPMPTTSTPAASRNTSKKIAFERCSPIETTVPMKTKSQRTVNQNTLAVTPATVFDTETSAKRAPQLDQAQFVTPAPRNETMPAIPGSSRQLRSAILKTAPKKELVLENSIQKSTRKVTFFTPPRDPQNMIEFPTPAQPRTPHVTIIISPDSPPRVLFTPATPKSPFISILIDSN